MVNIKAVIALMVYWFVLLGLNVWFMQPYATGTYQGPNVDFTTNPANETIASIPATTWLGLGFFQLLIDSGPKIISVAGFLVFGIGLPAGTPTWFAWLFAGVVFSINAILAVVIFGFIPGES